MEKNSLGTFGFGILTSFRCKPINASDESAKGGGAAAEAEAGDVSEPPAA